MAGGLSGEATTSVASPGTNGRGTGGRVALAAGAVLLAGLGTSSGAKAATFKRCPDAKFLQCAGVAVPLDRSGRVDGTLRLAVRRLPAARPPGRGTVVFVTGGPGQSAISGVRGLALAFRKQLPGHDFVTFDQRGTGLSGQLRCPGFFERTILRCARRLAPRRGLYHTVDSVDDLDAVRRAVGAPTISLFAVSYGGRVAGEYARRYPASVSRLALDSPTPLFGIDSLELPKQASLPRVLASVCALEACSSFTKSPFADLSRLAKRVRRRPLRVTLVAPSGRKLRTRLGATALYRLVANSDASSAVRAQIPAAVRSALRGDSAPLARLTVRALLLTGRAQAPLAGISPFTNRVTNCSESNLPWSPATKPGAGRRRALKRRVAALGPDAFAPWGAAVVVANSLADQCLSWPAVANPPPVSATPGPAVPTLVLNGQEDLRTPVEDGAGVASGYPGAQQLVIPYAGHSVFSSDQTGCARRATFAFLAGRATPVACPARPRPGRVAVPVPARLAKLPGRTRRAKTLLATALTLDDLLSQLDLASAPAFGGLRGGRVTLNRRAQSARLVGYQLLSGVRLTGRLSFAGKGFAGRLRIAGGGAAPARVVVARNGRLRLRFRGSRAGAVAAASTRLPRTEIPRTPRIVVPSP